MRQESGTQVPIIHANNAGENIVVPGQVFRGAVHNQVGAGIERVKQKGRRNRVVHDNTRAVLAGRLRNGRHVDDIQ